VIVALAGIDEPLEAFEGAGIGGEGFAGSAGQGDLDILYHEGVIGAIPEVGFDAAHAAKAPFALHQDVDEDALLGIDGAVVFVVFGGELGEVFGFFVEHDLVNGVDAVLEGVEAGGRLARSGARSGGFLCVFAIGRGLFRGRHASLDLRLAGVFGAAGSAGA
jgi:hypothetical protein